MATTLTSTQVEYRIAELNEDNELPANPVFYPLSADGSSASFTNEVTYEERNTFDSSRQRGKGDIVDFEASGSYDSAVTNPVVGTVKVNVVPCISFKY